MILDYVTSTGQHASGAGWLDAHFEAERENYVQIVRSVGIEPGWHVMDAGCGGGFIPVLAKLTVERGKTKALDHASENIDAVRNRLETSPQPCPVELVVGGLLSFQLLRRPCRDDWPGPGWVVYSRFLIDSRLRINVCRFSMSGRSLTRP